MKRLAFALLILLPLAVLADGLDALNFEPPDSDLSVIYLASIFGVVGDVLQGVGSQIMGVMFGVFNAAVLALGGIIVTYTMLVSTLNTANDGEVMGKKWSSIWIPLRSATGIALLLPKTTGYSFIQVFIMWIVVQGVGAADKIWEAALDYLLHGGVIIQSSFSPKFGNAAPATKASLTQLVQVAVCLEGLQKQLDKKWADDQRAHNNRDKPVPLLNETFNLNNINPESTSYERPVPIIPEGYDSYRDYEGVCGTLSWDKLGDTSPYDGEYASDTAKLDARTLALQHIISIVDDMAISVINNEDSNHPLPLGHCPSNKACDSTTWTGGDGGVPLLQGNALRKLFSAYTGIISPAIHKNTSADVEKWVEKAKEAGWIMAGSFYYDLSKINENARVNIDNKFPTIALRKPDKKSMCTKSNPQEVDKGVDALKRLPALSGQGGGCDELSEWVYGDKITNYLKDALDKYQVAYEGNGKASSSDNFGGSAHGPMKGIVKLIGSLGSYLKDLSNAQTSNENPLLILAKMGNNMIDTVTALWFMGLVFVGLSMALSTVPWVNLGIGISALIGWIMPFLTVLMTSLFTAGVLLAYYIPLMPYIIFIFGALGWMIGVIEAMVAAPLVAIGVMHPDGQHEFLGKSDQGLMLLLNVFLRPGMMVIGFIGGISLSYVGIWLLNAGIGRAMTLSKDNAGGMWFATAMAVIYATTAVSIVSKAFALIHLLPDKVLRWISGGITESLGSETAGEANKVKGAASSAGQQMGGALSKGQDAAASSAGRGWDDKNREAKKHSGDNKPDVSTKGKGQGGQGGLQDAGQGSSGVSGKK